MKDFDAKSAFTEIAKGDKDAYDFLCHFFRWVHKEDDLIDRDKVITADYGAGINLHLIATFQANAFVRKHFSFLWPVLVTSSLAYVASEEWKRRADVLDRMTAQVLKSEYMNVFFAVAFCVAGWDHAVEMQAKFRMYSFDAEPAP